MTNFARNKLELARLLRLSRRGLDRFFLLPDHPESRSDGRLPVEEWRAFVVARRSQPPHYGNNGNGGARKYEPTEREQALTMRASAEAARAQFRLSVEKGQYLPVTDICYQVETAHSAVRRELSKKLLHELPPKLEGLVAAEMKRPLRKLIEELSDNLVQQFKGYAVAGAECI
jgi:hypothetical protein